MKCFGCGGGAVGGVWMKCWGSNRWNTGTLGGLECCGVRSAGGVRGIDACEEFRSIGGGDSRWKVEWECLKFSFIT